jgi:hypothetical protein
VRSAAKLMSYDFSLLFFIFRILFLMTTVHVQRIIRAHIIIVRIKYWL